MRKRLRKVKGAKEMNEKPLFTYQQIFSLKRKTLEKRLMNYYQETHDEESVLKYLIALQVREELGTADFSFMLEKIVRQLLMKTKSTRAVRRYYIYFQNYFSDKEWRAITIRLFSLQDLVEEKVEKLRSLFRKFSGNLLAPS